MTRTPFSSKAASASWPIVPSVMIEEFFCYSEYCFRRLAQWGTMTEWAGEVLVITSLLLLFPFAPWFLIGLLSPTYRLVNFAKSFDSFIF